MKTTKRERKPQKKKRNTKAILKKNKLIQVTNKNNLFKFIFSNQNNQQYFVLSKININKYKKKSLDHFIRIISFHSYFNHLLVESPTIFDLIC